MTTPNSEEKQYPECEKMAAVQDRSQIIGEFLKWLQNTKELTIRELILEMSDDGESEMKYCPMCSVSIEKLLAEFFEIDLDIVEKERRQMLDEIQKHH